jgi:hypothetical protein
MSHNLFKIRMALVEKTPWHGLGARVSPDVNSQEMLRQANLPAIGARAIRKRRGPLATSVAIFACPICHATCQTGNDYVH